MKVSIVLFDGFDELDAIAPFEVFQMAARCGADLSVKLVSAHGQSVVTASHGLKVSTDDVWDDSCDWLLVPGGNYMSRSPRGAWAEIQGKVLPQKLSQMRKQGQKMASVCTGAMLLSAAGITSGRHVATHHGAAEALAKEGAVVVQNRVVDDGDLISAGGVTSGLDMALWFVERFFGAPVANEVAKQMEYPRTVQVHRGPAFTAK